MIERGNFAAAKSIIRKADGLSACGRNMVLVQSKVQHFPAKMKKLVKERNRLLYRDLSEALSAKDQKKSRDLWQLAMETCYACHQGTTGFQAVRKFTPPEEPHRYHQKVIEIYSLENGCQTCHFGNTSIRSYKDKR
jgi:protein-arginine kinase activator protein McsA